MSSGVTVRLNRIFGKDGRAVIVAMDHGLPGMHPLGHLKDPGALIDAIAAGGADAILTTPGIAKRFASHLGRLGLVLRLDGGATSIGDVPRESSLIASVEDAARLGADGVAVMGFCGTADEGKSLATLGRVAVECRALGLALMAEMLPLGFGGDPTVEEIAVAARIGAEMGADIVKTKYAGPPEAYRDVTEGCFVPVLVLGGSARDLGEVVREVDDAMAGGAAGVAIGRNVWRSEDVRSSVAGIVAAVRPAEAIRHGGPVGHGESGALR
jgi:DhnA family fructose-bisphosphate aldolase class Ia